MTTDAIEIWVLAIRRVDGTLEFLDGTFYSEHMARAEGLRRLGWQHMVPVLICRCVVQDSLIITDPAGIKPLTKMDVDD